VEVLGNSKLEVNNDSFSMLWEYVKKHQNGLTIHKFQQIIKDRSSALELGSAISIHF
jgi:hypothetical protein